jgi:hypothetical protein
MRTVVVVFLLLLVLVLVGSPACAADWIVLAGTDESMVWLDRASIREQSPGVWIAWQKFSYTKAKRNSLFGRAYRSTLQLNGFQCGRGTMARLQYMNYSLADGQGDIVANVTIQTPSWQYPPPDTVGETALTEVCKLVGAAARQRVSTSGRLRDTPEAHRPARWGYAPQTRTSPVLISRWRTCRT